VSAYDPRWPGRAAGYADELRPVLDQWLLGPIEHVGSTAIPGIVAKPVIDLMAQVTDPDAVVGRAGGTLGGMNWRYVPPELDGRPWRRFVAKVSPDGRRRNPDWRADACQAEAVRSGSVRGSPKMRSALLSGNPVKALIWWPARVSTSIPLARATGACGSRM
jgi:GrpB-like predicted nucleotidyltransferase (UPF0157 family)